MATSHGRRSRDDRLSRYIGVAVPCLPRRSPRTRQSALAAPNDATRPWSWVPIVISITSPTSIATAATTYGLVVTLFGASTAIPITVTSSLSIRCPVACLITIPDKPIHIPSVSYAPINAGRGSQHRTRLSLRQTRRQRTTQARPLRTHVGRCVPSYLGQDGTTYSRCSLVIQNPASRGGLTVHQSVGASLPS